MTVGTGRLLPRGQVLEVLMPSPFGKRSTPLSQLWALAAVFAFAGCAHGSLFGSEESASVLIVSVEEYILHDAEMQDALGILRGKDPQRILIGFETIKHRPGSQPRLIRNLHLRNQTVGQILQRLCAEDSRYAFEVMSDSRIVNVYLTSARRDARNLLNLRVSRFDVEENVHPQTLIQSIDRYAPELRDYLNEKRREHWERTAPPGAFPGSVLSGDAPAPRVSIHWRDLTIREILNAIVLYTSDHQNALGFSFPLSWKYEFLVDSSAPTGLGGRPRWDIF